MTTITHQKHERDPVRPQSAGHGARGGFHMDDLFKILIEGLFDPGHDFPFGSAVFRRLARHTNVSQEVTAGTGQVFQKT
jgi:hypothetical protein